MKVEKAKEFILNMTGSNVPASWEKVLQAGKKRGFGKTTMYDSLNALLKAGELAKDGDRLWFVPPDDKQVWQVLAETLDRWAIVRNQAVPIRNRVAAAHPIARMLYELPRVPYSSELFLQLRQDLLSLPEQVYVATLPMLQQLARMSRNERVLFLDPHKAEVGKEVKDSIWPSFRRRLACLHMDLEVLIECESILLEFLRSGGLSPGEVDWVAQWLVDQFVGASSREEYLVRRQTLRPLLQELLRNPRIRRRLRLRFARGSEALMDSKPWLSDLGEHLLSM